MISVFLRTAFAAMLLLSGVAATAQSETAPAQTIWRLLDYIAVDYAGAVSQGRIINQLEYDEMVEFSANVEQRLGQLPPTPGRPKLLTDAKSLRAVIAGKADPALVANSARR